MCRLLWIVAFTFVVGINGLQVPVAQLRDDDLASQVKDLQRNITDLWTYIYELRHAMTDSLNHLREHQETIENTLHKMTHQDSHTGDEGHGHGHEGEHSSHDQHGDHHSSHEEQGEHHSSHEQHDDHHSSHEQHGETQQSADSHSHTDYEHHHSGHEDSHGHDHHHHDHEDEHTHGDAYHGHDHDHKDSHEKTPDDQQKQQEEEVAAPVVTTTHSHHHDHHDHRGGRSDPLRLFHARHHHHGHHDHGHNRSQITYPKYSDYRQYNFAVCTVQPNRAIPEESQQNVMGQVSLWQKKTGGPLNIHVRLQGFKIGDHHAHHQMQQDNEAPVSQSGHRHGFHVHNSGDMSNGCQSTGPHYNPENGNHGGPNSEVRHVGDLGNIECDDHGFTNVIFSDNIASLTGDYSIVGKAIVIHADPDDYGTKPDDPESLKTGNAGARIACCVIESTDRLPLKAYKSIKSAKQLII